jgi:hypothetical protein
MRFQSDEESKLTQLLRDIRSRPMRRIFSLLAIAIFLCKISTPTYAGSTLAADLGAVALNGPWKFHIGDESRWAGQSFDDSTWETVDLTPLPGAHDGDQGLTHYTPGWSTRGHRGYAGFAWYRMTVRVPNTGTDSLWLAGPALVDNAYQLYLNGQLLGGIGDFSHTPPRIFGVHPRLFALPSELWAANGHELSAVLAVRVASLKGLSAGSDGGGIHIAPVLGTEAGVRDRYRLQWLEKAEAFAVDATEAVFFLLLAVLALSVAPYYSGDHFYIWIAIALILLAAAWFNQPLYWMGDFETLEEFVLWRLTILDGLLFGAWIMAWRAALGRQSSRWIAVVCACLTIMYLIMRPLSTPLLLPNLWPAVVSGFAAGVKVVRIGFLVLLVVVTTLGYSRKVSRTLLLTILVGSISVFGRELSQLGVPGIWFPYGVGLSRSECANAAFGVMLFIYLLQRLRRFTQIGRPAPAGSF